MDAATLAEKAPCAVDLFSSARCWAAVDLVTNSPPVYVFVAGSYCAQCILHWHRTRVIRQLRGGGRPWKLLFETPSGGLKTLTPGCQLSQQMIDYLRRFGAEPVASQPHTFTQASTPRPSARWKLLSLGFSVRLVGGIPTSGFCRHDSIG